MRSAWGFVYLRLREWGQETLSLTDLRRNSRRQKRGRVLCVLFLPACNSNSYRNLPWGLRCRPSSRQPPAQRVSKATSIHLPNYGCSQGDIGIEIPHNLFGCEQGFGFIIRERHLDRIQYCAHDGVYIKTIALSFARYRVQIPSPANTASLYLFLPGVPIKISCKFVSSATLYAEVVGFHVTWRV